MSNIKRGLSAAAVLAMTIVLGVCSSAVRNNVSVGEISVTAQEEISDKAKNVAVDGTKDPGRVLVVYYSHDDNTGAVAEKIAEIMKGDIAKIERADPYPANYQNIAKEEIEGEDRPAITLSTEHVADYDTIFVGYPVWYDEAPAMIVTFLGNSDFEGKTLVPFTLSTDATINNSTHIFKEQCPEAAMEEALTANSVEDVQPWLEKIGYLKSAEDGKK